MRSCSHRVRLVRWHVVVCLAALTLGPALAQSKIKLATLAPDGSPWHVELKSMGQDWLDQTDGRVVLVVYPGGVAGDDPDMVRKMRIGQLQAASLTVTGLADIDPAFNMFSTPLFFDSYEELTFVRDRMTPLLAKRLESKGFVLLHWTFGGWIYYFSKEQARTVEEVRELKIFAWAGDNLMLTIYKNNDFHPVPLAATDILTGLQTGMIEGLPVTPLAALSLQWFRQTPYMLNLRIAPLIGATLMSTRGWNRLSEGDRRAVLNAAKAAERRLDAEIPAKDAQAIEEMRERGLTLVAPAAGEEARQWNELAERFVLLMESAPPEVREAARKARAEFRARASAAADSSP